MNTFLALLRGINVGGGAGCSKLTIDYFERRLGVRATVRNWKTLIKLLALAQPRR